MVFTRGIQRAATLHSAVMVGDLSPRCDSISRGPLPGRTLHHICTVKCQQLQFILCCTLPGAHISFIQVGLICHDMFDHRRSLKDLVQSMCNAVPAPGIVLCQVNCRMEEMQCCAGTTAEICLCEGCMQDTGKSQSYSRKMPVSTQ